MKVIPQRWTTCGVFATISGIAATVALLQVAAVAIGAFQQMPWSALRYAYLVMPLTWLSFAVAASVVPRRQRNLPVAIGRQT